MTKVYIVILNWNNTADTIECINSLRNLLYENYQIILVDNGSELNSYNTLKKWYFKEFYECKILKRKEHSLLNMENDILKGYDNKLIVIENGDNLGFAAGNNIALRLILDKGEKNSYVLVLNNDTMVRPDFLSPLVEFMHNNKDYVACTPQIRYYNPKDRIWNCGGKITWFGNRKYYYVNKPIDIVPQNGSNDITFITGCALFFKPLSTGIFTEKFFFGEEDFEFSMRMKRKKMKMSCVYDSVIFHKVGQSIKNENEFNEKRFFLHYASRLINQKDLYSHPQKYLIMLINLSYAFYLLSFKYNFGIKKSIIFIITLIKYIINKKYISKEDFLKLIN